MLNQMLNAVEDLQHEEAAPAPIPADALFEDEWEKRGRLALEKLVLAEFARHIAAQFVLKKEENRAQQVCWS